MDKKPTTGSQVGPGIETFCCLADTPLTRRGASWFPAAQLLAWAVFYRASRKRDPQVCRSQAVQEGFLQMAVMLGSEWGHNLAHLTAAHWIGKPMDQLQVQLGMPRCIYNQLNDREVSPRQHIIRALGGPVFNLLLLPLAAAASLITRKGTPAGRTARVALHTNLFLSLISWLPIPGIDGGPILKWSLVGKGRTVQEADELVRQANGPLAAILGVFGGISFARKRIFPGLLLSMLGLTSLAVYKGWIKEENFREL